MKNVLTSFLYGIKKEFLVIKITIEIVEFFKTCKKNDIKVFFYASYSSATWSDARHNKIQEYCDSKGIEFVDAEDYREEIGFDDYTDYYDMRDNGGGDHLNVSGAHKTTDFLANKLINDYGVHKTDNPEANAAFEKDLPYYHKLLAE